MSKVRKTLTLDEEVVEEFEQDEDSLSATVNRVLWAEIERRRRMAALGRTLKKWDEWYGPADQEKVAEYRKLFQ
jgi:hypothetical protein